jgi:hypothetical protein
MTATERSPAYQKFIDSMKLTGAELRDGTGYDMEALASVTEKERTQLAALLAERLETWPDWREIEALKVLGTLRARRAIRAVLRSGNLELRMRAAEALLELGETADLEGAIVQALRKTTLLNGLSLAIDLAEQHPSPRIEQVLLERALHGNEDQRIHCAALALYLGGKADEPFDWNHRPFFLQFIEDDRRTQVQAYRELCRRLGVTPEVQ